MSRSDTATDRYQAPMDIVWQFDYAIDIHKLRELYSKAKRFQWDAEQQIDWDQAIDPSKPLIDEDRSAVMQLPFMQQLDARRKAAFNAHNTAYVLSQFLHGEQGALMVAAQQVHAVPDYEAKLYAATQTMDEARHVEVFERYVRKLAEIYPISPMLKAVIDQTLTADHWVKVCIGMQMIIEGLALGAFHNMRRATADPLLRQLVEYVLRDESRHVAFGNVYVGAAIADMHSDDRENVAQFAFETMRYMVEANGGGRRRGQVNMPDPGYVRVLEDSDIDPADFVRGVQQGLAQGIRPGRAVGAIHAFKELMMPALVRVGAVTERTRALFAEAQIKVYDDARTLEALEDRDI
ncbi:MAG TPA: ferritin-like domain-containing protein [Candidatus Acidoferrales bacterium]|nr:ferritin-like domain-containing protein [Candidatus Acidoferrales bacterium]